MSLLFDLGRELRFVEMDADGFGFAAVFLCHGAVYVCQYSYGPVFIPAPKEFRAIVFGLSVCWRGPSGVFVYGFENGTSIVKCNRLANAHPVCDSFVRGFFKGKNWLEARLRDHRRFAGRCYFGL